jgi:hypothetical protein
MPIANTYTTIGRRPHARIPTHGDNRLPDSGVGTDCLGDVDLGAEDLGAEPGHISQLMPRLLQMLWTLAS